MLLAAMPSWAADLNEPLRVQRDGSVLVPLNGAARDVVVGNSAIADVSLQGARRLVVIGKGYGETSLTVLDGAGRVLVQRPVVVVAPDLRQVSVITADKDGVRETSFSCAPRCIRLADGPPAPPASR
jgi:Flp pilus assembly secretin CpaC